MSVRLNRLDMILGICVLAMPLINGAKYSIEKHTLNRSAAYCQEHHLSTSGNDWTLVYGRFDQQTKPYRLALDALFLAAAGVGCAAGWKWVRLKKCLHQKPKLLYGEQSYPTTKIR